MSKKVTINKTSKDGLTKTKIVKDTSKKSGRQQLRSEKIARKQAFNDNARRTAIAGELSTAAASSVAAKYNAQAEKERERNKTYQAAIAKWNGILKSTPDPTEGSNDPIQGSNGSGKDTGSNQDNDSYQGW